MSILLLSVIVIGSLGLLFGLGLAFAAKKLAVPVDERVTQLEEVLPGANCGACGFAGCSAYADSIVFKKAEINKCAPGGAEVLEKIAGIMGLNAEASEPVVAKVLCKGGDKEAKRSSVYEGVQTCAAANLTGGGKDCPYGCLGLGDCVAVCEFDAIHMNDNHIPVVDEDKCTGCGMCAEACPRDIIEMMPKTTYLTVNCKSEDKGAQVMKYCSVGCIGCSICVKLNNGEGITMKNNLAVVEPSQFHGDGMAAEKCPKKTIVFQADKYEKLQQK